MNFECCLAWSYCSAVAPPFYWLSLLKRSCNSSVILVELVLPNCGGRSGRRRCDTAERDTTARLCALGA